jgi:hypothetical protein
MDQDADGILGESTQDQFVAAFTLGDQHVFNSTDTPKPLGALAITKSFLNVTEDLGIADLDVRIHISSPDVGFLSAALFSPTGARSTLVPMTGEERGPEYRDSLFRTKPLTPSAAALVYTGTFRPDTTLPVMDNHHARHGHWRC